MTISLPDARELSDEVLECLRLRALHGCQLGYTEGQMADILGVARETVSRWWTAFATQGLEGLPHERTGRPLGSGRLLSDQQAKRLQELLDHKQPEQLGIKAPLWNRRAVRDLIRKEYAIDLSVRAVGTYLKRWGYTAKRPRRHARDQDPEEVRQWLEETYPRIEEKARQEDAEIHWCDETGVAAADHPGCGYARRGQAATREEPDPHLRMNVVSTITNAGAVHFWTYTDAMDAALFLVFLGRLVSSVPKKILLILDRLPGHVAAAVDDWVADHSDQIELFYLPRYAPERNADEYLNQDLKGTVNAAGLPHDKGELYSHIHAFMQRLLQLPEHVRSYFQHPAVQYASATEL